MKFNKLKKEFEKFNYDLEYKTSLDGRGYYIRKFGNLEEQYYCSKQILINHLEALKEKEIDMEFEK